MITAALVAAAATLATPVAGALGHRRLRQAAGARQMRIETPNGIDEQGYVRIGGIEQWISVRGEDRANPVMLEIHGGPGASNSIYGPRTRAWEKHFTIVRWDMRGTGKTLRRPAADHQGDLSFARMYEDAVEVTHHVRARLGTDRVVLVANSFGSAFGLRLARQYPDLYSAYVGTDQSVHDAGRDHRAHRALLARLEAAGKRKELATLEEMGPDRRTWTSEQYGAYAKIVATSDPLTFATMKSVVMKSLWFSPLHSLGELGALGKGMKLSEQILPATAHFDDWADGTTFDLPFFIFQGDQDVLTPTHLAQRFFDDVHAPVKSFALIEDASHFASFRHPEQFLHLMLTKVRPLVTHQRQPVAE
ncbi:MULTISPECIES: alpha/beta fold hydrolase [unclassified Streptomyces]|uniref:alpha/beta fold hydrolase n=1 Tax=unclassified Streptomyces TaxID=2593676 RepID=UPI001E5328A8|nr:alpha/beta hydrolase [Streptomyces sp. MBT42]MCD2469500.1 alpha/beta hydrolase [Streptomyces sp. MBT42]